MIESSVGCEGIEEHVAATGGLDTSDVFDFMESGRGEVDRSDGFCGMRTGRRMVGEGHRKTSSRELFYIGNVIAVRKWSFLHLHLGSRLTSAKKRSVMSFTMSHEAPD